MEPTWVLLQVEVLFGLMALKIKLRNVALMILPATGYIIVFILQLHLRVLTTILTYPGCPMMVVAVVAPIKHGRKQAQV
jgi:hypothetical protein